MQPNIRQSLKLSTFFVLSFVIYSLLVSDVAAQFRNNTSSAKPTASSNTLVNESDFFRQPIEDVSAHIPGLDEAAKVIQPSHKSGFLAGGLSLILPGLGEYYVGDQIWRGLIFTAIDAGLWFGRYHYLGRGDDSNTAFQNFSNTYWSPKKYADSLNSLLALAKRSFRVTNADDFSQINMAEDSLVILGFENFTHRLPEKGSQQYYELISKYIQFTYGWKDAITNDPTKSAQYQQAANMRAEMNHQYEIADDFLYGLFLNRILSAIDAVLLAKDHNTPIHLEGALQQKQYLDGTMGFIPTAKLQYRF